MVVEDIFYYQQEAMLDLILDALQKKDFELLRGIQTLDSAIEWTGVQGIEAIMSTLIVESMHVAEEAKEIRSKLVVDADHYMDLDLYEVIQRRAQRFEERWIPLRRVARACKGLTRAIEAIQTLGSLGLIEWVQFDPKDGESVHIRLSPMWGGIIEGMERDGVSTDVFGSPMGKMLSIAITKKGFSSLIPLIASYNKAEQKEGEITHEDLLECYGMTHLPQRHMALLLERDAKKVDAIKAYVFNNGRRLIANPAGLRMNKDWRNLANSRYRRIKG